MCLFCFGCGMCGKPQSPQMRDFYNRPRTCLKCGAELEQDAVECAACGEPAVLEAGVMRDQVAQAEPQAVACVSAEAGKGGA